MNIADAILRRIAERYKHCSVNIYPAMPELTPVEAVLRCASEEGFDLVQHSSLPPDEASDIQKLDMICTLINRLTPAFRDSVLKELPAISEKSEPVIPSAIAPKTPADVLELQVNIMTVADQVRVTFGKQVSWIQFPVNQAVQFAILLLEHCGAKIEKTVVPATPPA